MTKIGPAAAPKNLSNRSDYACKTDENRYIGARACRPSVVGAPLRASRNTWRLGPYSFWTSCGIYLKGGGAKREISLGAKAFRRFPEVRPVQDCRCRLPA